MTSVLITGASKGLGRATAIEFASRGYDVIATARDVAALADLEVAKKLQLDVTDQASVDSAIAAAGQIDILVSNAGMIFVGSVEASPIAEIAALFEQNTLGSVRVAQAVLPQMRKRGSGRLLFVSSVLGRVAFTGNGAYAGTKWALEGLVETLALETAEFGIKTTLLEPGDISTGSTDDPRFFRLPEDPYAGKLSVESTSDSSTVITPEEAARAIVDAAELDVPPFRVPVGGAATYVLGLRASAPEDAVFALG